MACWAAVIAMGVSPYFMVRNTAGTFHADVINFRFNV